MPTIAPRRCSAASTDLLERLDVWPRCQDKAAALQIMRLVDDTGRLIRAPEVRFSSDEIGLEQFGYNIDNRSLMVALEERAAELPNLTRFDDEAASDRPAGCDRHRSRPARASSLTARLVIGADGRQSPSRAAAGIAVKRRDLHQSALTFNIAIRGPHNEHLHRVSHAAGSVRVRAAARQPLQRGVGLATRRKPNG